MPSSYSPAGWRRRRAELGWTLIWTLIPPVSCVSCVSSWYSVNAAETHETIHWESGMRYQITHHNILGFGTSLHYNMLWFQS